MEFNLFKGFERLDGEFPAKQVEYALNNPKEVIPELLEILKYTVENAENISKDPDDLIHIPVIYLLAYFQEDRAFDDLMQLLQMSDEIAVPILESIISEDLHRIIASIFNGDQNCLMMILKNENIDAFIRKDVLLALVVLLNMGKVSRDELVSILKEFLGADLDEDYDPLLDVIPDLSGLIHPKGLMEDIKRICLENKDFNSVVDFGYLRYQMKKSVKRVLDELKEDPEYSPILLEDVDNLEKWMSDVLDEEEFIEDSEFMEFFQRLFDDDGFDEYIDDDDYDDFDEDDDDEDIMDNISFFDPDRKKR